MAAAAASVVVVVVALLVLLVVVCHVLLDVCCYSRFIVWFCFCLIVVYIN